MSVEDLAAALNQLGSAEQRWIGDALEIPGATSEDVVRTLSRIGSWAAVLWESGSSIGHMVIVEGMDRSGRLRISDPWGKTARARNGSSYKMEMEEFLRFWNLQGVFLR